MQYTLYSLFRYFSLGGEKLMQFAFCQKIRQYDVIMTSNSVNMSIKVSSEMLEKKSTLFCAILDRVS